MPAKRTKRTKTTAQAEPGVIDVLNARVAAQEAMRGGDGAQKWGGEGNIKPYLFVAQEATQDTIAICKALDEITRKIEALTRAIQGGEDG